MMTVRSGLKSYESLEKCHRLPAGSVLKTFLGCCLSSMVWRSSLCFLRWKLKGTKCSRLLYQLAVSMPRTGGKGYGLWPTPAAQDSDPITGGDLYVTQNGTVRARYGNTSSNRGLDAAVRMWPTPKSEPSGPDYARANRPGSGGDDLATAVAMWPTPRSSPASIYAEDDDTFLSRNAGNARETLPRIARKLDGCQGGQLSPRWECWLMGYPLDWLDLPDGSQSQTSPEPPRGERDRVNKIEALGNAVVPQLVEALGRMILAADDSAAR